MHRNFHVYRNKAREFSYPHSPDRSGSTLTPVLLTITTFHPFFVVWIKKRCNQRKSIASMTFEYNIFKKENMTQTKQKKDFMKEKLFNCFNQFCVSEEVFCVLLYVTVFTLFIHSVFPTCRFLFNFLIVNRLH